MKHSSATVIEVLHFNDVYEISPLQSEEPVGGAARFAGLVSNRAESSLLLFSGDALSPSLLSSYTKGEHMVEVLNLMSVDCAVVGNHDFDFGVDHLSSAIEASNFPWLLSNVVDNFTGNVLGDALVTHIFERAGKRIGIVGLVEPEWVVTLSTISAEDVQVSDFVRTGEELSASLKNDDKCDIVIALTHMRWPNNIKLAEETTSIDLILSGHDHFYQSANINGKLVVVSGSDFRHLSKIKIAFSEDSTVEMELEKVDVHSALSENLEMKALIDRYAATMGANLEKPLGTIKTELDGRFSTIRTQETSLGNFICNIVYSALSVDVVLINGGTFRSDRIHPAGPFTLRDLSSVLPFQDPIVVIEVTGRQLLLALENSCSQWPKAEGRFAQVAGVKFAFDVRRPSGARVLSQLVHVDEAPLDLERVYRLGVKSFMADGKDGYDCLLGAPCLIGGHEAQMLNTLVENYFESVQIVRGTKRQRSFHRQSIVSRRCSVVQRALSVVSTSVDASSVPAALDRRLRFVRQTSIQDVEEKAVRASLAPCIDGRIIRIETDQMVECLTREFDRTLSAPIAEAD